MTSEYREWSWPGAGGVVACRWEQRVSGEGAGHVQRVLPDGCADVIVIDGRHALVVGPTAEPALPELAPETAVRGLRIRTEAIRAVFGVPGSELRDRSLPLEDVFGLPAARHLVDALLEPAVGGEDWLRRWLSDSGTRVDGRVSAAVGQLQRSRSVDVASVAAVVGLSCRQLRRVVEAETGLGPKTLQRIGRLQRFLRLTDAAAPGARAPGAPGPGAPSAAPGGTRLAEWAAMAGYADQAHLAKDVTELAATTPARLVAERLAGAA